jgi:hypothetical protein
MPRAVRPCLEPNCGKPSYGDRCRQHANIETGLKRRAYKHDFLFEERQDRPTAMPERSWWADGGDFYAEAKKQNERFQRGTGISYTPRESFL